MKCTNCSMVIKPVVAIDIDGTLGDYHSHFLEFADRYLCEGSLSIYSYRGDQPFKQWFLKRFETDERTWHDIKLAYRQGAQKRTMPAFSGAARIAAGVRNEGAELWLTTTRPYLRLDNVDPDTREWLRRNNVLYDHLIYDEHKYRRLAELVDTERVVAVVDDLPELIDEAEKELGWEVPILKIGPYNRAFYAKGIERLSDIQTIIMRRIQKWREEKHE